MIQKIDENDLIKDIVEWSKIELSEDAGGVHRIIFFLDYMVRSRNVPKSLYKVKLVEWDNNDVDENGNEW